MSLETIELNCRCTCPHCGYVADMLGSVAGPIGQPLRGGVSLCTLCLEPYVWTGLVTRVCCGGRIKLFFGSRQMSDDERTLIRAIPNWEKTLEAATEACRLQPSIASRPKECVDPERN